MNIMKDTLSKIYRIKKEASEIMPLIRDEIDRIISNRVTSESKIEEVLETLLNFSPLGIGTKEFKKLNSYYKTINKKYTEVYEHLLAESI